MTLTAVELNDQEYNRALGRAVAAELKLRGALHKEVAAAIGMDPTLLSARLNGKTPFKSPELQRIAMATGASVADFYRHVGGADQTFIKPRSATRNNRTGPGRKSRSGRTPGHTGTPATLAPVAA